MKNTQIPIRVSSETKLVLKKKAATLNMTLSQYMLHAALNHETKVLSEGSAILSTLSEIHNKLNDLVCISPEDEIKIQNKLKAIVCNVKEKL